MHGCFAVDASAWEWLAWVWAFYFCKPLHWAASRQLMPVSALPLTDAHIHHAGHGETATTAAARPRAAGRKGGRKAPQYETDAGERKHRRKHAPARAL